MLTTSLQVYNFEPSHYFTGKSFTVQNQNKHIYNSTDRGKDAPTIVGELGATYATTVHSMRRNEHPQQTTEECLTTPTSNTVAHPYL